MKFLPFITILVFSSAICNFCRSQTIQEIVPGNTGGYDKIHTNDLLLQGENETVNLETADIEGTPFWNENWNTAILHTANEAILVPRVKLNFFTDDVYYTTPEGQAMIAKKGAVKRIEFLKANDTGNVIADFVYLKHGNDEKYHFYQVLNTGVTKLIKLNNVTINKSLFNPLSGKTDLNYMTKAGYYLYYNANLFPLKTLSKDAVFTVLNPGPEVIEWLNKHNNKLKSESDIIQFLSYFNAHVD